MSLRVGLPPLPKRMAALPLDSRGYPVPWFVKWFAGKPDFRIVDVLKFRAAIRFGKCWICGEATGARKSFVIGPISTLSRVTSEPGSHLTCAEYAVKVCPFLILPSAKRRGNNMPEGAREPPGVHDNRNAGIFAVWTTRRYGLIPMTAGRRLLELHEPLSVEWYSYGEPATRAQAAQAVDASLSVLYPRAKAESIDAVIRLESQYAAIQGFLPP